MGKLVLTLGEIPQILKRRHPPKIFRLLVQVVDYDSSSGILSIRSIPDHLLNAKGFSQNDLNENDWNVDMSFVLDDLQNPSCLMTGTVVSIEATVREDKMLIASEIFEVDEPETIMDNLQILRKMESL